MEESERDCVCKDEAVDEEVESYRDHYLIEELVTTIALRTFRCIVLNFILSLNFLLWLLIVMEFVRNFSDSL